MTHNPYLLSDLTTKILTNAASLGKGIVKPLPYFLFTLSNSVVPEASRLQQGAARIER